MQDEMNLSARRLRRYARALFAGHPGPSEIADDLVEATLRRAFEGGAPGQRTDFNIRLYSLITEMHRETLRKGSFGASAACEKGSFYAGGLRPAEKMPSPSPPRDQLSGALVGLRLEEREALLLVVIEGFSYAQAARILKIAQPILIARLARARAALGELPAAAGSPKTKLRPSHLRVVK